MISPADDIGRVASARAFRVIHVNSASADRGERLFEEPAFVQRVGVQLDLKVELVSDREAGVDDRGHRAPILMDL